MIIYILSLYAYIVYRIIIVLYRIYCTKNRPTVVHVLWFFKNAIKKKLKQSALMKQSIFMLAKFKFNQIILLIIIGQARQLFYPCG